MLYASDLAEGLGFEPSHNDFRDRRATVTLALSMRGRDSGIRTHTGRILSPLSLPVGLYPHDEAKDSDFHRGGRLKTEIFDCVLGTGRHTWQYYAIATKVPRICTARLKPYQLDSPFVLSTKGWNFRL